MAKGDITFLFKEVTFESEGQLDTVYATRHRSSKGTAGIKVRCGNQYLDFDKASMGDSYEMIAREVIDALTKAVNDPCNLPKEE